MMRRQRDEESRAFYDLSALVLSLLRSSTPMQISLPDQFPESVHRRYSSSATYISPTGLAWLLRGISVALLMLSGTVTFFIGFLLLPWVLALIMVFYVAIDTLLRLDASFLFLQKRRFLIGSFFDVASETCKTLYYHLEAEEAKDGF